MLLGGLFCESIDKNNFTFDLFRSICPVYLVHNDCMPAYSSCDRAGNVNYIEGHAQ